MSEFTAPLAAGAAPSAQPPTMAPTTPATTLAKACKMTVATTDVTTLAGAGAGAGVGASASASAGAPLVLQSLSVRLGTRLLVDRLDAHIAPGEVLAVMGPSGSGKSSLLMALIGALESPFEASGRILLGAEDMTLLPTEQRRIGLMFQDDLLFPHMTVARNLLFALPARPGEHAPARLARVEAALVQAGLAGMGGRWPGSLSGGQRSRVALLRALLAQPRALLLDEPFSRLDHGLRQQIRAVVWTTLRERGVPALIVTHDPADVPEGARIVTLREAGKVAGASASLGAGAGAGVGGGGSGGGSGSGSVGVGVGADAGRGDADAARRQGPADA